MPFLPIREGKLMRKLLFCFIAMLFVSGLYGVGEKIISIGASSGWRSMETRQGLIEIPQLRPHPVLGLSSVAPVARTSYTDLYLSFDEGSPARFTDLIGNYDVYTSQALKAVGEPLARRGSGAANFSTMDNGRLAAGSGERVPLRNSLEEGPLVIRPRRGALFSPGSYVRDFSIDFWLNPSSLESGEQILSWSSSFSASTREYTFQRIQLIVSRNRLQWVFTNFFSDPEGKILREPGASGNVPRTITLTGSPILPKTWSHHLIRFKADLGLLEYLIDGRVEALTYTTSSGREGGEVNTPIIGEDCSLVLGSVYTGQIDELRISSQYLETPVLGKYLPQGGRAESRPIDLGSPQARLLKIEATGGRVRGTGNSQNEYVGQRGFLFADHSELRFYARFSNNPYQWNNSPWIPVETGKDMPGTFLGRYVQIAVDFFPSGDRETTPYLEELRLIYRPVDPIPPPSYLVALAKDGAVELSWRAVTDINLGGYLVYYGTSSENYFGEQGAPSSPLDAGNRTSIRIEGLKNGTLYYFTVASYDKILKEPGDFSRETASRPQREFLVGQ
jgi:hypothetical protein